MDDRTLTGTRRVGAGGPKFGRVPGVKDPRWCGAGAYSRLAWLVPQPGSNKSGYRLPGHRCVRALPTLPAAHANRWKPLRVETAPLQPSHDLRWIYELLIAYHKPSSCYSRMLPLLQPDRASISLAATAMCPPLNFGPADAAVVHRSNELPSKNIVVNINAEENHG